MQCPKCNKELDENIKFCPYCGEKVSNEQKVVGYEIDYKEQNSTNNPLHKYEVRLQNKEDYICIDENDFKTNSYSEFKMFIWALIGIILGIIWAFMTNDIDGFFFEFIATIKSIVGLIVMLIIGFFVSFNNISDEEVKMADLMGKINKHNDEVFDYYVNNCLTKHNINNVTKEIRINNSEYKFEKILIDDENKIFNYINLSMSKSSGATTSKVQQAKYEDILRYSYQDLSTSTQSATSTTSSNSGKALGGAVASQILIGNATAGAVIGGSGARTTETTYKTTVNRKYQITIYLNKLQDSVITIILTSGNTTNEIIATLEYILNSKG